MPSDTQKCEKKIRQVNERLRGLHLTLNCLDNSLQGLHSKIVTFPGGLPRASLEQEKFVARIQRMRGALQAYYGTASKAAKTGPQGQALRAYGQAAKSLFGTKTGGLYGDYYRFAKLEAQKRH